MYYAVFRRSILLMATCVIPCLRLIWAVFFIWVIFSGMPLLGQLRPSLLLMTGNGLLTGFSILWLPLLNSPLPKSLNGKNLALCLSISLSVFLAKSVKCVPFLIWGLVSFYLEFSCSILSISCSLSQNTQFPKQIKMSHVYPYNFSKTTAIYLWGEKKSTLFQLTN